MIDFIKGTVAELTPTYCVLETNGVGYDVSISLNTYTEIGARSQVMLYIHESIREDAFQLFGFTQKMERELFRKLITVSGIGPSIARVMLSSMNPKELSIAIIEGNVNLLKTIKGIGAKTAERVIVDLKDKVKLDGDILFGESKGIVTSNMASVEAVAALVMLGYNQKASEKVVQKIASMSGDMKVDQIIKQALKML